MTDFDLLEIFSAKRGVVSCVGAGGKKTTMFSLAGQHPGRVAITATAHIEYFPESLAATNYIGDEESLLKAISADRESSVIAFAKPSSRFGRRAGINPDLVDTFMEAGKFDLMVIKADGARGRYIKAPSAHEPAISIRSDVVIPILSAKVIGQALDDEIVHRVDMFSSVTGLAPGEEIRPMHVARLLSSELGSLKGVGQAKVIPLINMVDDDSIKSNAVLAARQALDLTDRFDRIVVAAMKKQKPVVTVIER